MENAIFAKIPTINKFFQSVFDVAYQKIAAMPTNAAVVV